MKITTLGAVLAVMLLLIAPVSAVASTVIFPGDETNTVELSGFNDQGGERIVRVKQTTTDSYQFVFHLDLITNSDFNWILCTEQLPDTSCERYLWVAMTFPSGYLTFFEYLADGLGLQPVTPLGNLPTFTPFYRPALRLGNDDPDNPFKFFTRPYPILQRLLGMTQTTVNLLGPGTHTIYAGWSRRLTRTNDLNELFDHKVSNVAEWQLTIEEPTAACGQVQVAGGDTPDRRVIDLGQTAGTFRFDFETFVQEDRIILTYQGLVGFDTGCVGTSGSVFLRYSGSSTNVTVQVFPNCAGGSNTAWKYAVHCPSFP